MKSEFELNKVTYMRAGSWVSADVCFHSAAVKERRPLEAGVTWPDPHTLSPVGLTQAVHTKISTAVCLMHAHMVSLSLYIYIYIKKIFP